MKFFYTILFLCCCQILSAQISSNFNLNRQYYVKGDALIIGNNILSKHKKKSFNDQFVINDQVKMRYVDIDNDNTTFSSSQATLNIPENTKKIVNATLYWSAIYSFNRGVKRKRGNKIYYKGNQVRDDSIQKIKFKTPNNLYQNIEGKILYDGYQKSKKSDNAPYVCYLDVTDIVTKNQNVNGTYTVANIKATQGFTSGGSSGGWLLHIVYESENDSPKYINTYHGITSINKKPLQITLKDFKTVNEGSVKASLTLAALEGDSGLGKDQCLIYNQTKEKFILLENKLRFGNNFFNSSITRNEKHFKDRLPYSINNLGFDIAEMDLRNRNNEIITNATTSLRLKLQTKSDRFHLFFASFETEVDTVFFKDKEYEKIVKQEESLLQEEIIIKRSICVNNLQPGYYVVTNVFSKPGFANSWKTFLISKNYNPTIFLNPENKWQYVSIYNNIDKDKAILELEKLQEKEYFKDLWLQKINMD